MKLCKRLGCILLTSTIFCGTSAEILPETAWAIEVNVPTISLKADQPVQYTMGVSQRVQLIARELLESMDGSDNPDAGSGTQKNPEDEWVSVTKWSSENESVATVTQGGLVTAVMAGHTKIYGAYEDGRIVTCELTVYNSEAAALTLTPEKSAMYIGETQQITATVTPEAASQNTKITWSSSNTSVLTVSDSGKVTAVGAGEATITAATNNGVSASCVMKVSNYTATGISLSAQTLNLAAGSQAALTVTVYPAQANTQVTWTTSNAAVAIVNSSGKVTGINAGTAVITATVGNVQATCTVTVYSNTVQPGGVISPGTSTFTGTTGGSVYIPNTTMAAPNTAQEYMMPAHIPALAFVTVDSDLGQNTSTVLAQLKMYGIRATFFVPVDNLYGSDNLLREIIGEGHSIGLLLTAQQAADGAQAVALLDQANQQLSVITGTPTRLVRASGGSIAAGVTQESLAALQQGGYSLWDWDSAPESYQAAVAALDQENITTLRFDSNDASTATTLQQLLPYIQYCGIPAKPLSTSDTPVCQVS